MSTVLFLVPRAVVVVLYKSMVKGLMHIKFQNKMCRVGQNHIYTVYIRYFWQENHQIYDHIRCIYTVLANPKNVCSLLHRGGQQKAQGGLEAHPNNVRLRGKFPFFS